MNEDEIYRLEVEIEKEEYRIERLKRELEESIKNKSNLRDELEKLNKGLCDDIEKGTKLIFKDSYDEIYEIVVVGDSKRLDALLLSDNSHIYDFMIPYYLFGYKCIYGYTLVATIEEEYNLKLVEVIKK